MIVGAVLPVRECKQIKPGVTTNFILNSPVCEILRSHHGNFVKRHEVNERREVRSHQTGVVISRHIERVEILVINVVIKQFHSPEIFTVTD